MDELRRRVHAENRAQLFGEEQAARVHQQQKQSEAAWSCQERNRKGKLRAGARRRRVQSKRDAPRALRRSQARV